MMERGNEDIDSIVGGYDANQRPLYPCVAFYNESKQPGEDSGFQCNFSYGGQQLHTNHYTTVGPNVHSFETFVGFNFLVGFDTDGTGLYACRTILPDESWQAGKYRPGFNNQCHVGWGGREVTGIGNTILDGG